MVCKEDVVLWFKGLKSHTRIDVMCNLFNLCLPFELRFLGTCLEDLGKRDFHDLRTTETSANNPSELSSPDLQCISDKRARTKLALYISLLHSCNYACSNGFYKILSNIEEVNNLIKSNGVSSADDEVLEELLLIYTLALNHPAFTFEQKLYLGEVFTKLQQEEERRQCVKRTRPLQGSSGLEQLDKVQMQAYQPCGSPDQIQMHPPNNTGHCTPMTPAALTGDPLVSMPDPLMGYLPYSLMGYHPTMVLPPPPPDQRSPMVSRTNSPCQSNSPSRAGSPGKPKTLPPSFNRPPPPVVDPLRAEQIGKDGPLHMSNAGKPTSMEQLRWMTDEELREKGFNNQSINQFRTLETKLQATNGYNLPGKKLPPAEPEPNPHSDVSGAGPLRRYNSADGPLNPPAPAPAPAPQPQFYYPACLATPPCLTCVVGTYRGAPHAKFPPQLVHQLRCMSLEHDAGSLHNSSASDSASDHSPPDTPSLSTTSSERGGPGGGVGPVELWEEQRLPEAGVVGGDERGGRIVAGHGRARGVGRSSRTNPPGIQTLPRGRGHNPPHRRRDTNSANGTLDDRKVFSGSEGGNGGGGVTFPYSTAPLFPHNQFIHAAYPSFTSQGSVFRLPFHHPNGDMLYHPLPPPTGQFLPTRPVPPSHLPFSPLVPPPKISCYNCGSQSHIGPDCPEATIEEITNKGQYRIDYTNNLYPKPGECSTTQDK